MLLDIIEPHYAGDYCVYLMFEDGVHGVIDLTDCAHDDGVFQPLKDKTFFEKLSVDHKVGTITWPNGADLSPEFLYERLKITQEKR